MKIKLLLLLLALFAASSCDIIDEPYVKEPINGGNDDNDEAVYKVLLEKFTGHRCVACPSANEQAELLKETYKNQLIVISYHFGFFASPNSSFPADYRTPEGDEIGNSFGVSALPTGMLNRKGLINHGQWIPVAQDLMENTPTIKLSITHEFNPNTNELSVTANAEAIAEVNELFICIFITEDKINSPQVTPDGTIADYEHNSVFRASLNGTWGNKIFAGGASIGNNDEVTVNGVISNDWNTNNINIVCFVYNDENGEVIQAEAKSMI